jgi:hypothetical protein
MKLISNHFKNYIFNLYILKLFYYEIISSISYHFLIIIFNFLKGERRKGNR